MRFKYPKLVAAAEMERLVKASTAVREAIDVQWTVCPRAFRPVLLDHLREVVQELEHEQEG